MAYLNKRARVGMLAAALLSVSLISSCGSDPLTLDVLAIGEGGATVTGEYQKLIEYGSSASFEVSVPEGETVIQVFSDDVLVKDFTYENGILTLGGITAPQTLRIVAGDPEEKIYWSADSSDTKYGGYAQSNVDQGRTLLGSMITMNAVVRNNGATFVGWSLKKPLDEGGELLSTEEQFTFELDAGKFIYANFDTSNVDIPVEQTKPSQSQSNKNAVTIYYNNNGGDVIDGNKAAIETSFNTSFWKTGVGREDDGTLTRDGYVLLGYTRDPENEGELIRPGYRYLFENGESMLTLYAAWAKETDPASFTTSEVSGGVSIDGYSGSDAIIYIPREIDGKTVKQIGGSAFTGNETITEVHITSSVTRVADNAFANCPNLTTLTIYDNVTKITDKAFEGTAIDTIRFCAATKPRYVNNAWAFGKKFERVMLTEDTRRVVVLSGSSQFYGVDTDAMQKLFPEEYSVINYGTHAGANVLFFCESVSAFLDEDDILLYTPEQYGQNTWYTSGNPEFPSLTLQVFEGSYNLFEHFDATNYTGVFDAIGQYNTDRQKMKTTSWDTKADGNDEWGDYIYIRKNLNEKTYHRDNNGKFHFDTEAIPADFLPNLNRVLEKAQEGGTTVLFGHPSYNLNAVLPEFRNEESYDIYNQFLEDNICVEVISDIRDYIYEGQNFADTDYHLNLIGRVPHYKNLARDIKAALGID